MLPALLDGRELAERLGCSQADVMKWHRLGRIPSVKTSSRVYFNLDRVAEAIRERSRQEAGKAVSA